MTGGAGDSLPCDSSAAGGGVALPGAARGVPRIRFAEFFAGIGLVRAALEPLGFDVVWANDVEKVKRDLYAANHPAGDFVLGDVRDVRGKCLPAGLRLATSSFPCIDVSLAGNRRGLAGSQSGMFWEFARVIDELGPAARPCALLLENVVGFASSHGGEDLRRALARLNGLGYSCDVFTIDARHFVPQSRPRMFVIGISGRLPGGCHAGVPRISHVRPAWIRDIYLRHRGLDMHHRDLPPLPEGPSDLAGVIEPMASGDPRWWGKERLEAFTGSLSPIQWRRFDALVHGPQMSWRTAYRRTRAGRPVWEIRRDGIAGCLRTTGGGSSKQALVETGHGEARVRWMTPVEYARLMGARGYRLRGATSNQALFGFGDAVAVDVIRWIGKHYLVPALSALSETEQETALTLSENLA